MGKQSLAPPSPIIRAAEGGWGGEGRFYPPKSSVVAGWQTA